MPIENLPDASALRELIDRMPPAERQAYESFFSLTAEAAFIGRRMIVYDLVGGRPTNIETFQVLSFYLEKGGEPTIEIRAQGDGRLQVQRLGVVPTRFRDRDLFLSVPQRFEFRWAGRRVDGRVSFRPHFGILIKTPSRPDRLQEGATGCLTSKRFQTLFPGYEDEIRF